MNKHTFPKPLLLPALIASLLHSQAHASLVRADIDYQYFRDFAENKGQFTVGAMNVPIYNKSGENIGTMLPNIPMVDFSAINSNGGIATLIDPQYIVSVAHNGSYSGVQFGSIENHPDSPAFTYQLVHNNNYTKNSTNPYPDDYHTPRLHKLVTEVAPAEGVENINENYGNRSRYPLVVRAGSGTQQLWENKQFKGVAGAYQFLTGGATPNPSGSGHYFSATWGIEGGVYGPMVTVGLGGDSGSGMFVYDNQEQKWKFLATTNSVFAGAIGNQASVNRHDYNQRIISANTTPLHNATKDAQWIWRHTATRGTHQISNGSESHSVGAFNPDLTGRRGQINQQLNHGKTVVFTGEAGRLHFAGNVHQGAGALFFETDYTVTAKDGSAWQGAGISVADGKTVDWQVDGIKGDRLSKIGAGTLQINAKGKNEGDISVGDGVVILNQQADANGEKQAFANLGIVSGRPTVVVGSSDQMDWNNLYFGFRGGRLDLNGNDIQMQRLKHSDDGARIVNRASQSATLTLTGLPEATADTLNWGQWGKADGDVYEYTNTHRWGRKDYFILKGNPSAYYPLDKQTDNNWEYLGSNDGGKQTAIAEAIKRKNQKQSITAFGGTLGEGGDALNLIYAPSVAGNTLLLTGNSHTNGNIEIQNGGTLHISGRPTPHAYDHLGKKEIVKDDDWLTRQHTVGQIIAHENSQLIVGRNIDALNSNLTAKDGARIALGYTNGQTPVCHRSDYTGVVGCTTPTYEKSVTDTIARLHHTGDIALGKNTTLTTGKTDLHSAITADENSQITLGSESHWTLTNNSAIGNLTMQNGAQITLSQTGDYHHLHIQGDLSGSGQIHYRTDLGKMQSDSVRVTGSATGDFTLLVKNSGQEPQKSKERLTLLTLNPDKQNGKTLNVRLANANERVDIGAYRYELINENTTGNYRLYNPIVEAQITEEERKQAEAEKQRQEEEKRKQAEEEAKRQAEEARKAEEEAKKQAEAEKKRLEAEKQAEEEAKRKAEEEAKKQAQAQAEAEKQRLAEEAKKKAEEEAKRKAEAEAEAQQQAALISRYTNTALSEQAAHFHTLGQLTHDHFKRLSDDGDGFFMRGARQKTTHQSDAHRSYQKDENRLTIGQSKTTDTRSGRLNAGAHYTFANATQQFDDGASGKNQTHHIGLHAKHTLNNGVYLALQTAHTASKSDIHLEGKTAVNRHAHTIGLSVGKRLTTPRLSATVAIGLSHNRLSAARYNLGGASVHESAQTLQGYHAALTLEKPINAGQLTLTPYLSADYLKYTKDTALSVNGQRFVQPLNDQQNLGAGLKLAVGNWQTHLQATYGKSKDTDSDKSAQIGIQYQW